VSTGVAQVSSNLVSGLYSTISSRLCPHPARSHPWTKDSAAVTADALAGLNRAEEAKALREKYRIEEWLKFLIRSFAKPATSS